jgi:DNA-binding MarR family transcriptional regulator
VSEHASASLPPESSLGYLVNHLARLLALALRDRIEPYGVVPGQFAQLLALYEADGLTQAELCARVQIEQPTMANTLARMERDGLITRTPDPADQRRSLVRLTPKARRLEPDLVAAAQDINALATQGLTDDQITAFRTALGAAVANLETARSRRYRRTRTEEVSS